MSKYLRGILLAGLGLFGTAGCTSTDKKPGTVRPVRPDEPRESRKTDPVPPTISKLAPEEITPDNFEQYAKMLENEMDRDLRAYERQQRRSAARD